jgi:hypothetical protein
MFPVNQKFTVMRFRLERAYLPVFNCPGTRVFSDVVFVAGEIVAIGVYSWEKTRE